MQTKIEVMESKMAEMESRMKLDTRNVYLQMSLLVAIVFIGGIIAWKI